MLAAPPRPVTEDVVRDRYRELIKQGYVDYERCRRRMLYYLENFCYTVDEHEKEDPVRPLLHGDKALDPATLQLVRDLDGREDDYLRIVSLAWEKEPLLAVPKSRQMRLTHVCVAWHGWLAQFWPGKRIAIQSKNFEDADALLERLHQSWIAQRERHPNMPWLTYKRTTGRIVLPNGSILMAIAQGAHKLRSYTFSAIMSDEMAFQDEAEQAFTAALPTIDGGDTKYTAISSANPGFFQDLVFDSIRLH